jgi:hypothetical protein
MTSPFKIGMMAIVAALIVSGILFEVNAHKKSLEAEQRNARYRQP